jgi:hydroxymethylpyrimidine kinase / phosphomethylpyrimidine kinase / thiamine-phosphate diphosphorylase
VTQRPTPRPIVWSIAGTDSGGGAGLAADLRSADAFGVHLCPVVAAVTAQNSLAVTRVEPVSASLLEAQLEALENDLPPQAIKTGLLGSAQAVATVARWVDRLRRRAPVALVVDPVQAASTGAVFADEAVARAYRDLLLPRASLLTPNRREAAWLLGPAQPCSHGTVPQQAHALRTAGAAAVCVTGGDSADLDGQVLDWMDSPHAAGWLASARVHTPHVHGTGCTFATAAACALALGFVAADALVLAKMATLQALRGSAAAGQGAGPVRARPGFAGEPALLPRLSWGELPGFAAAPAPAVPRPLGLYAVVDSAQRVQQVLAAGVTTVQLRIKAPATSPGLRDALRTAIAAARMAGALLFVNDHWELALELGAQGVHLGQEDLLALDDARRALLISSGLAIGVSSHSLWELCRARSLAPRYIACGPVWPTLTKAMPWQPQGLHNLAWWCAMAGAPVVAIGGILEPDQAQAAAACGADGVCVVRALGDSPALTVPLFQRALAQAHGGPAAKPPEWPQPSLLTG